MGVEDYVCDLTLVLRNIIHGGRRRRSIEVNKYRRSAHYKGEYPCTVTTRGLAVFPLDAREPPDGTVVERYSSGVEGLDALTHGGWLRNSIIIVRGPTGSGKTMLAGLYARAGAAHASLSPRNPARRPARGQVECGGSCAYRAAAPAFRVGITARLYFGATRVARRYPPIKTGTCFSETYERSEARQ